MNKEHEVVIAELQQPHLPAPLRKGGITAINSSDPNAAIDILTWLACQSMLRGESVVWLDTAPNDGMANRLHSLVESTNTGHVFNSISFFQPWNSCQWNPLLTDDAKLAIEMAMHTIPTKGEQLDLHRECARHSLTCIISALIRMEYRFTFLDLAMFFVKPEIMLALADEIEQKHPECDETHAMQLLCQTYMENDGFDIKKFKASVGQSGGHLYAFGTGNMSKITGTYTPHALFPDDQREKLVTHVCIPDMASEHISEALREIVMESLVSALESSTDNPATIILAPAVDGKGFTPHLHSLLRDRLSQNNIYLACCEESGHQNLLSTWGGAGSTSIEVVKKDKEALTISHSEIGATERMATLPVLENIEWEKFSITRESGLVAGVKQASVFSKTQALNM